MDVWKVSHRDLIRICCGMWNGTSVKITHMSFKGPCWNFRVLYSSFEITIYFVISPLWCWTWNISGKSRFVFSPGGHLNIKMSSYQYRDSHVKDKTVPPTVSDRLIFNMGIPIPGKDGLYIETGPRLLAQPVHQWAWYWLCMIKVPCLPQGRVSIIFAIPVLINDRKYKYTFMFSIINSALQKLKFETMVDLDCN